MLSLVIAVAISASIVRAASTLSESRFKPQYFTRKRILPFEKLLRYLLSIPLSFYCTLNAIGTLGMLKVLNSSQTIGQSP